MTDAWLVGAGIRSALGDSVAATVEVLRRPPSAPRMLDVPLGAGVEVVPSLGMAGAVEEDPENRLYRLVEGAAREAIAEAELGPDELKTTALLLGTSSLDISMTEAAYARDLASGGEAYPLMSNSSMGEMGRVLAKRLGVGGMDLTINTACTASANALVYGDMLVRTRRASHALILGTELFNRTTALGFRSLDLLAPDGMRPFDKNRRGIVLGEACAAVVVGPERREGAFRLTGSANLCDTHGISAANPDGSTVAAVMREALGAAGVAPGDVAAVKSHGTASLLNDEAEAAGLRQVFGDGLPPLCALKPFIGHAFGACGLAELVMLLGAASAGFVPGTPGVGADPSDLGVSLTQGPTPVGRGDFLLNYFGFGGNNTALVMSNG
ncbi:MAG: beta-ketoacyl synthase [Alphaproteobacteria bacterium]|nr:beta-ketoacyl synthase [Alphaproteobacteria bacterium]